jgi:hypothetical protein
LNQGPGRMAGTGGTAGCRRYLLQWTVFSRPGSCRPLLCPRRSSVASRMEWADARAHFLNIAFRATLFRSECHSPSLHGVTEVVGLGGFDDVDACASPQTAEPSAAADLPTSPPKPRTPAPPPGACSLLPRGWHIARRRLFAC